jgi:hypothetical protein
MLCDIAIIKMRFHPCSYNPLIPIDDIRLIQYIYLRTSQTLAFLVRWDSTLEYHQYLQIIWDLIILIQRSLTLRTRRILAPTCDPSIATSDLCSTSYKGSRRCNGEGGNDQLREMSDPLIQIQKRMN